MLTNGKINIPPEYMELLNSYNIRNVAELRENAWRHPVLMQILLSTYQQLPYLTS